MAEFPFFNDGQNNYSTHNLVGECLLKAVKKIHCFKQTQWLDCSLKKSVMQRNVFIIITLSV